MYTYYFEKLEVWQNARSLVKDVYEQTRSFPEAEKFGLTNQLRRATISIGLNIAEGFSRKGQKDKARFINQAYSSTCEVIACLVLSHDLCFITIDVYSALRSKAEQISNQLNALHKVVTQANDFTTNNFTNPQQPI